MPILVCRIGWADVYGSDAALSGGMAFVKKTQTGHEVLNFTPANDGIYYGYFPTSPWDLRLGIEKLGAAQDSDAVDDVLVVWVSSPGGGAPTVVVGWYEEARVHATPVARPDGVPIHYRTETGLAVELPTKRRTFEIVDVPTANRYYIEEHDPDLAKRLVRYCRRHGQMIAQSEETFEESRRLSRHYRIERNGQRAQMIKERRGYRCEACKYQPDDRLGDAGKAAIEVHHKIPLAELRIGSSRKVHPDKDFLVLCANCHRTIHRMPNQRDISVLQ